MPTTFLTIFISLLAGHFAADFALQTEDFVRRKRELGTLAVHAGLVALVSYLFLGLPSAWPIALAVGLVHGLIDFVKTRSTRQELALFLLDQGMHFVTLALIAYAGAARLQGEVAIWSGMFGVDYYRVLVVLTGALAAVYASSFAVDIAVKPLIRQIKDHDGGEQDDLAVEHQRGLLRGGRFIGYLERSLIFLFVLVDVPSAIGFLIAAKSIFRFGELSDRSNRVEAEYIIIGTLMSFLLGLLCAFATRALLAALGS